MIAIVILCWTLSPFRGDASEFISKKEFVQSRLPDGQTFKMKTIVLDSAKQAVLANTWELSTMPQKITYIFTRDSTGALTGAVTFITTYGIGHNDAHKVAVALDTDGAVADVVLMERTSRYHDMVSRRSFLAQFSRSGAKKLHSDTHGISAVSGATESSRAVIEAVRAAVAVYREFLASE